MEILKKTLKTRLEDASRIAVLGIGSDLRGDDAAGMIAAEKIKKFFKTSRRIKVYLGGTAPENLTGEIKRFKPTHLLIIDTADMKEKPGTILFLDPEIIGEGVTFTTHKLPAKVLVQYFQSSFPCKVIFIGIQPKAIDFGKAVSKAVESASSAVAKAFKYACS